MSEEDAKVAITELVALLDSHSGVFPDEIGFHFYGLLPYEFAEGDYIVPEMLAPLRVRNGIGRHVEPNVWLRHAV